MSGALGGSGSGGATTTGAWSRDLRDLMWRATCWGRVKVAWQTGHLWSPPMMSRAGSGRAEKMTMFFFVVI